MLDNLINSANGFLWGMPMLVVIGLGGIALTLYLGFPQFRHFGDAWKRILDKGDPSKTGGVSPFASFCTTMAMRVGTGNVAGVAVAVYAGGPGAVFWMFLIGITNSCVCFCETTQGSMYKTKIDGEYRGGPYYVSERGLGWKAYGTFIAIISFLGIGLFMPSAATNTVCVAFAEATGVPQIVFAAIIAVAMFITCLGGIKRISDAASAVVPFMVAVYLICFVVILVTNIGETGRVFGSIFANAFTADGVLGGGIGIAIQQGVKRGTFSSASGMGESTPTAAAAESPHPVRVGLANMAGVWVDTNIVCTVSALMILYTDCFNTAFGYVGAGHPGLATQTSGSAVMVQYAASHVLGNFAGVFIALMLFLFSFTCLISYYYEAETAATYLFQKPEQANIRKGCTWFLRIGMPILIFYYGIVGAAMAWNLADLALGSITFFNMLVVVLLAKPVKGMLKDYEAQKKAGKDPYYDPATVSYKGVDVELWKEINSNYIAANK